MPHNLKEIYKGVLRDKGNVTITKDYWHGLSITVLTTQKNVEIDGIAINELEITSHVYISKNTL